MESTQLDFSEVCDGNTLKLVSSLASYLGVPNEYIFFPLIGCVGASLGRTRIRINEAWHEKCSTWIAVGSRRGTRKTAVISYFSKVMQDVQRTSYWAEKNEFQTTRAHNGNTHNTTNEALNKRATPPSILCDYMTSEEFRGFYKCGPPYALSLFEDLSLAIDMLDFKSRPMNRVLMERMYDGIQHHEWSVYNIFGFVNDLNVNHSFVCDDTNPLWDKFMMTSTLSDAFYSKSFKVPMPANTPDLTEVLKIVFQKHCLVDQPPTYSLSPSASMHFKYICDEFTTMQDTTNDERVKRIWRKSKGHFVKIACLLKALQHSLKMVVYGEAQANTEWPYEICLQDLNGAKLVVEHCAKIASAMFIDNDSLRHIEIEPSSILEPVLINPSSQYMPRNHQEAFNNICIKEEPYDHDAPLPKKKRSRATSSYPFSAALMAHNPVMINESMADMTSQTTRTRSPADFQTPEEMAQRIVSLNIPDVVHGLDDSNHTYPEMEQYCVGLGLQQAVHPMLPLSNFSCNGRAPMNLEESALFVKTYSKKLKKLLEFNLDHRVTPSVAAQRHLMPALSKQEMVAYNTPTKYPAALGKEFLIQVSRLGFGRIETVTHPTNKKISMFLQKLPYSELGDLQKRIVRELGLSEVIYNEAFMRGIIPVQ